MTEPFSTRHPLVEGNLSEVMVLVEKDPGYVNKMLMVKNGRLTLLASPLHVASRLGHADIVAYLLDHGANTNRKVGLCGGNSVEEEGTTPLYYACYADHVKVVELLLARGADPTLSSRDGTTPLMAASYAGRLDCVRSLMSHDVAKATINAQSINGATALHYACLQNEEDVVGMLVDAGADLIVVDKSDFTPMSLAKAVGSKEVIRLLQVSVRQGPCHWITTYSHFKG